MPVHKAMAETRLGSVVRERWGNPISLSSGASLPLLFSGESGLSGLAVPTEH